MNSVWQQLFGALHHWRQGSWLLQWSEAIGAILISLVFLLSPFFATALSGILLLACGSYWLLLILADEGQVRLTLIHIFVLVYWSVAVIATAFSPVRDAAISGLIILSLYLLLFGLTAKVLRNSKLRSWVIAAYLLVALVVSIYGIRQQIFGVAQLATWNDPASALARDTRVYSYLGNPNLLAGYLVPAVTLSLAALLVWRSWMQKMLAATMVVLNSACLYFTDSRGGWLALLVALIVFALLCYYWFLDYLSPFWRVWLLPIVFSIFAGLLVCAVMVVEPLRLRLMSIFVGRRDSSNNFRINVWEAVFKMIQERPLVGIGPGNDAFNQVYPLYMNPGYPALSAYSIFLETTVEMGFVGLAAFVSVILASLRQGLVYMRRLRQSFDNQAFWLVAALAAMAGLIMQGLFDTVWYRPQINTLWWLLVGLIASYDTKAVKKS